MAELVEPITGPASRDRASEVGGSAFSASRSPSRAGAWATVRAWPIARQFLLALLVIYLAKQAINVFIFPPFTGHDEVAQYAYLRTVATEGRVPELPDARAWIATGDPNSEPSGDFIPDDLYPYCLYVLGWIGTNVCETDNPTYLNDPPHWRTYSQGLGPQLVGYQYAANHPPMTYLLMTPIYWLTDGSSPESQLYVLRAAMIPFGLLTVVLAYLTVRAVFPRDTFLAITVPAYVAFQTQISYEAAMFNNDILAVAAYSVVLYLLVIGIRDRFPTRICVLTGFALGIGLLIKSTALTAAPLIAVAIVLAVGLRNVRTWVAKGALTVAVTGVLVWPWYLFLYRTYGNLDALDQINALQWFNYWSPDTATRRDPPTFMELFWNKGFALLRWNETWGMFGWRRLPLSMNWLWAIGIPHLVALFGLLVYAVVAISRRSWLGFDRVLRPTRWQTHVLVLLLLTAVVAYLAVIQFGLTFALTQSRYFFPAINAVAILLMLGLRTLIPQSWHRYGQAAVVAALILMTVLLYSQYVVPYRLEGWT